MIDIHKMTVLIIDDMENMCRTIRGMLKVLGFGQKFIFGTNGEEAWETLQKEPIDLVISDYNMPIMSGAELVSRIREDRNLKDLPMIMITAMAQMEFVTESAESEIDAYILKPVTVKLLEEKVSSVIAKANNPSPMVAHLKKARSFENYGDLDAAVAEAQLAAESNPKSSRPLREIGYLYFKKNDFEEAEKWLLQAAQMNYMDVVAFHYLGDLYLKQNDIDNAAKYFDKAMKLSPRHLSRGINFGKILLENGMVEKAIQIFKKALKMSGSTLELREEIANLCVEKGAKEYGAQLLELIINEAPKRADLLLKLGITLEEIGENDRAIVYLSDAEELDQENHTIKLHLARNYLAIDMPIRAEKPLKLLLNADPKHREAQELLRKCV